MEEVTPQLVGTAAGRVEVAVVGDLTRPLPVVVMVHGLPGDWRQARTLALEVADRATVLLPSRPGYGRTPVRSGRTPEQQAQAYVALLDALGVERAAVVGISGGAPSSYSLARDHHDRCSGLVLVCGVAAHLIKPPTPMRVLGAVPGLWELAAALDRRRQRSINDDHRRLEQWLVHDLTDVERAAVPFDPRMRSDLMSFAEDRIHAMRGVRGLRNDSRQLQRRFGTAPASWPAAATMPVRVLHGDADPVVPLAHAEWYAEHVPQAQLTVLPGYGHPIPITAREATTAAIDAVL